MTIPMRMFRARGCLTNGEARDFWRPYYEIPVKDRLREIIRQRMAPAAIVKNSTKLPIYESNDVREQRARDTLRRIIGEGKYKAFLANGFVSVKAKSGRVYRLFPGNNLTQVYQDGRLQEKLCVVLSGNFPPTDSLIVRYVMILNNEDQFRKLAIPHGMPRPKDTRTLAEIARELKRKSG